MRVMIKIRVDNTTQSMPLYHCNTLRPKQKIFTGQVFWGLTKERIVGTTYRPSNQAAGPEEVQGWRVSITETLSSRILPLAIQQQHIWPAKRGSVFVYTGTGILGIQKGSGQISEEMMGQISELAVFFLKEGPGRGGMWLQHTILT